MSDHNQWECARHLRSHQNQIVMLHSVRVAGSRNSVQHTGVGRGATPMLAGNRFPSHLPTSR